MAKRNFVSLSILLVLHDSDLAMFYIAMVIRFGREVLTAAVTAYYFER